MLGGEILEVTFHRIVKTNPPTLRDFTSGAVLGQRLLRPNLEVMRLHTGISVFEAMAQATELAARFLHLGAFIAVLDIGDTAEIRTERTTRSAGHHTLWGEPAEILEHVVAVVPIQDVQ